MTNKNILQDLEDIYSGTTDLWSEFKNTQIFITGGTGFFGTWLLESFIWANKELNLNNTIYVLTRNIEIYSKKNLTFTLSSAINVLYGEHIYNTDDTVSSATIKNEGLVLLFILLPSPFKITSSITACIEYATSISNCVKRSASGFLTGLPNNLENLLFLIVRPVV